MPGSLASPLDHFEKFQQKADIQAQFSEDMRHVMTGLTGSSSRGDGIGTRNMRGMRTMSHSPGLGAAAALALGSTARFPSVDSKDPSTIAREVRDRGRGQSCPFDDHSAFRREGSTHSLGLGETARGRTAGRTASPLAQRQQREAYEASKSEGKQIRDRGTRVFGNSPFDAPEKALPLSSYAAAAEAVAAGTTGMKTMLPGERKPPVGAPTQRPDYSEAKHAAVENRQRMAGTNGLLAGNYLTGESRTSVPVGKSGKPPPAGGLLPQAMLKAQMDKLPVNQERAAFLNAKVMSEACRSRNSNSLLHFC